MDHERAGVAPAGAPRPKLLEQVRTAVRRKHYSARTPRKEEASAALQAH